MTTPPSYLEGLPSAEMYERSYMHKEPLCFGKNRVVITMSKVLMSMKYEYIFTMSVDGFLKFWKKV